MKPPAFQFYPADFLAGVAAMTQAEVGAYILLLCHQWNHGSTPAEPERQQIVARGSVSEHVISKFERGTDGKLRNTRMEKERQKQADFRELQKQKGIASGLARAKQRFNPGSTTAQPSGQPDGQPKPNSLSSSSSSLPTKLTKDGKATASRFEKALGDQWCNDAGKWINRIKFESPKTSRVIAEVESAIKENRISTTPAQYAEQIWKEFK